MGKHKAMTALKQAAAVEDLGLGQGCARRTGKLPEFYISGYFVPLHLQERRKLHIVQT